MKTIMGVSSATPINKKLKNGYTTFDALTVDNVYARDEKVLESMW